LGKPYFKALLQGNTFTLKRMEKYRKKGYTIGYPSIDVNKTYMEPKVDTKKVISPERWITEKIMTNVILLISYNRMNNFNNHFNLTILFLDLMKKIELKGDTSRKILPNDLFKFSNLKILLNNMYSPIVDIINTEQPFNMGAFTWSINNLLYILLCKSTVIRVDNESTYSLFTEGMGSCYYILPWTKYITDVTGIILMGSIGETRGFNDEHVPLCNGEVAPFSKGMNGIPLEMTDQQLKKMTQNGIEAFILNNDSMQNILESTYPDLKLPIPLTAVERLALQQAKQAERNAAFIQRQIEEGTVIEEAEEEEEAEGTYKLPETDIEVPARCFSELDTGDINTRTWYPTPGTVLLLLEFAPGLEPDLVCTSVKDLKRQMRDNNNILYRCTVPEGGHVYFPPGESELLRLQDLGPHDPYDIRTEDVDESVEYVPFTYAVDERGSTRGYLTKSSIERIITASNSSDNARVFKLKFIDSISHTYNKVGSGGLGANHCQAGSTVLLFDVEDYGNESEVERAIDIIALQAELTEAVDIAQQNTRRVTIELREAQENLQIIQDIYNTQQENGVPYNILEATQEDWVNAASLVGTAEQQLTVEHINLDEAIDRLQAIQQDSSPNPIVPRSGVAPRELFPPGSGVAPRELFPPGSPLVPRELLYGGTPTGSAVGSVSADMDIYPIKFEYDKYKEIQSDMIELDNDSERVSASTVGSRERILDEIRRDYNDTKEKLKISTIRLLNLFNAKHRKYTAEYKTAQDRLLLDTHILLEFETTPEYQLLQDTILRLSGLINSEKEIRNILENIVDYQADILEATQEELWRSYFDNEMLKLINENSEIIN